LNDFPTGPVLITLFFLIALSGFFSGSETALMTLNRYRLRNLAKNGHSGAVKAAALLEKPDRLIGLILLGNNFVNILASALATARTHTGYFNFCRSIAKDLRNVKT